MSMVSGYLIWWHLSSVVVDVYRGSLLTTWLAATSSLAHFATSSSLLLRAPRRPISPVPRPRDS